MQVYLQVGLRFDKNLPFFFNLKKSGKIFIKNGIVYVNLPFIYKNLIILSLLKIVTLKLTTHILTTLTYSLKLYIIGK